MLASDDTISYIFWDWDGTLCLQHYFWPHSIKADPEVRKLQAIWKRAEKSHRWMLGHESLEYLRQKFDCSLAYAELADRLSDEWPDETTINKPLFSSISQIFPHAKHVIVTDNMDIFNEYAKRSKFLQSNIDAIFNSCDYHAMKAMSPSLFEFVQKELKLTNFNECLLLDDSADACDTFLNLGGNSIHVTRNERV